MAEGFASGLIWPALILAALGWVVPRLLGRIWPEGVRPLIVLALVATGLMLLAGTLLFVALYVWQGVPFATLFEAGVAAGLVHFVRLGLVSALLWAPIMVLSIAGLPKRWETETW